MVQPSVLFSCSDGGSEGGFCTWRTQATVRTATFREASVTPGLESASLQDGDESGMVHPAVPGGGEGAVRS